VVDNLDAPWKVPTDTDGEQFLVVRNGTPMTVPLANMNSDLAAHPDDGQPTAKALGPLRRGRGYRSPTIDQWSNALVEAFGLVRSE
jgi:hypothetical protein